LVVVVVVIPYKLIFFVFCCFWYRGYNYFWMVYLIIFRVQLKLVILLSYNRMRKRYQIQRNNLMRLFELLGRKLLLAFVTNKGKNLG